MGILCTLPPRARAERNGWAAYIERSQCGSPKRRHPCCRSHNGKTVANFQCQRRVSVVDTFLQPSNGPGGSVPHKNEWDIPIGMQKVYRRLERWRRKRRPRSAIPKALWAAAAAVVREHGINQTWQVL